MYNKTGRLYVQLFTKAFSVLLCFLFCLLTVSFPYSHATTTSKISKEDLIVSVSNPSNGVVTFYVNAPAKSSVKCDLTLKINSRTNSTSSTTFKNSSASPVKKKITLYPKYYSTNYKVSATATTGNSQKKTLYTDTDDASSVLKSTVTSKAFVWDDKNIKKYARVKQLSILFVTATGVAIDCTIASTVAGALFTVVNFAKDEYSAGNVASSKAIQTTPIKDWSYKFKLVPSSKNKAIGYLIVYDNKGKLNSTYNVANYSFSKYIPVVK